MKPASLKSRVQRHKEMQDADNAATDNRKSKLLREKKKKKSSKKPLDPFVVTALEDGDFGEEDFDGEELEKKKPGKKLHWKQDKERDDWGIEKYEPKETPIKKISKLKKSNLRSILATNREELLALVESDDVDTATAAIYKRMLQALVDVVGHSEDMIHRTKGVRGTHQLNLLVTSIRDVLLDLQQAQDRGMLAENLCSRYIGPSYLAIGMEILKENELLFNRIKREFDKATVDRYSSHFTDQEKRLGDFVQSQFLQVREEVKKFLKR